MGLSAASSVFGPVVQVDTTLWISVTASLVVVWTCFILLLARRAARRLARQRELHDFAARYGGYGPYGVGGHQPVAVMIVQTDVILGRLEPIAKRRVQHRVARTSRTGDVRLNYLWRQSFN